MLFPEALEFLKGQSVIGLEPITQAGSNRRYDRVRTDDGSYILCRSANRAENATFIYLTQLFREAGAKVPELLAVSVDQEAYLLSDNGAECLLDRVLREGHSASVMDLYRKALDELARLQDAGTKQVDFSRLSPSAFDEHAVLADLNYFKYYFLDLQQLAYDRAALTQEFRALAGQCAQSACSGFMFRDCQGRNILVKGDALTFIDYQGGMYGPLAYDAASLLWQARAALPAEWRDQLLDHYIAALQAYRSVDATAFREEYSRLVLIRLLQVLGAYGLRGLIEKKSHFVRSIPEGLRNLQVWLSEYALADFPVLRGVLQALTTEERIEAFRTPQAAADTALQVRVQSFSYKQGIPADESGNGGGFVFDCRGILNPGRFEEYKKLTGRDRPVIEFLEQRTKVAEFLAAAKAAVDISVDDYLRRGFSHLMISFGCTGGQHRSVYCADAMARHLQEKYGLRPELRHVEQEKKNWVN